MSLAHHIVESWTGENDSRGGSGDVSPQFRKLRKILGKKYSKESLTDN